MSSEKRTIAFEKPKCQNSYFKKNPQYFDDLVRLIENHPMKFSLILNKKGRRREKGVAPEYQYLNEWVNEVTGGKLGAERYKTPTKCYWIIHDMHDFPVCETCGGNKEWFESRNVHFWTGYGSTCSALCRQRSEKTKASRRATCVRLYGCENVFQSREKMAKISRTKAERYGDPEFRNKDKAMRTKRQRAEGDPEYMNRILEKRKRTSIERFGYDNPAKSEQVMAKTRRKYAYRGKTFDSAAELCFYIFALDTGARIERATRSFEYSCNGKAYKYFPDFLDAENSCYIEIKGDQFFRPDGTMYIPWKPKGMPDGAYQSLCEKAEAKRRCMVANGVKILRWSSGQVQKAIQYVKAKYGKDYVQRFRYAKTRRP